MLFTEMVKAQAFKNKANMRQLLSRNLPLNAFSSFEDQSLPAKKSERERVARMKATECAYYRRYFRLFVEVVA